jgi:AraC-like DNA-binding protein
VDGESPTASTLCASVYAAVVDAIAGLLDGPRARGAFLLRSSMDPPWSVRIQDEAPLTVLAVVRGEAWFTLAGDRPTRLEPGDVAVVRGPRPYVVADEPGRTVQAVVLPGQVCTDPEGGPSAVMRFHGTRTWGNSPDGATLLATGTYQLHSEVSRRLLTALPALLLVRRAEWTTPLVGILADEIGDPQPGQEAVLDRLLDLVLISVLRAWAARPDGATGWYRAQADPVAGAALRLMHERPEHPWTLDVLAREVGVSRALLARRFRELVGETPMAFLTQWRLALAADLLREPGATVGSVARQVGYGSSYALSTAFKRVRGVSPQQHRRRPPAPSAA